MSESKQVKVPCTQQKGSQGTFNMLFELHQLLLHPEYIFWWMLKE